MTEEPRVGASCAEDPVEDEVVLGRRLVCDDTELEQPLETQPTDSCDPCHIVGYVSDCEGRASVDLEVEG
jgi:hypothetical protein